MPKKSNCIHSKRDETTTKTFIVKISDLGEFRLDQIINSWQQLLNSQPHCTTAWSTFDASSVGSTCNWNHNDGKSSYTHSLKLWFTVTYSCHCLFPFLFLFLFVRCYRRIYFASFLRHWRLCLCTLQCCACFYALSIMFEHFFAIIIILIWLESRVEKSVYETMTNQIESN